MKLNKPQRKNMKIHQKCPYRTGKSHPRDRNFNQGRVLPSSWLKYLPRGRDFPLLHGLAHDGFFFSSLSGLFLHVRPAWSRETEVSHMGKKLISYRQRWEKMLLLTCAPIEDSIQPVHLRSLVRFYFASLAIQIAHREESDQIVRMHMLI